jgi:hypothetical protein
MTFRTVFLNSFIDPARRRHTLARIAESFIPATLVLAAVTRSPWALAYAAAITFGEYALFEFVLERFTTWTGNYWERGPRDDETFQIP